MIQITELRLPINHTPQDLEQSILSRLKIEAIDLIGFRYLNVAMMHEKIVPCL